MIVQNLVLTSVRFSILKHDLIFDFIIELFMNITIEVKLLLVPRKSCHRAIA